ncbi:MAG: CBS domain-containing protein [Chloroflexi bacterium]|nr:CBS domain-containing protein [Chloroflexota bacterium]
MKKKVVYIGAKATIQEAAAKFVKQHVGELPVVDDEKKPIGIVNLRDMLSLELPDFVRFVEDVDFVHDFGAVETTRPTADLLVRPITVLMQPVIPVDENCGLLRAYALMLQHNLLDMPVVNKAGKLVGIVSRVDIGTAILALWPGVESKKS